jgi:hypothetical protein
LEIRDGGELVDLLLRGWEIEKRFEGISYDESLRYAMWDKAKKVLPDLVYDSGRHLMLVESMIARVKTPHLNSGYSQHVSTFPFEKTWDAEMMREIRRVEKRAAETYSVVLERLRESDSSAYLNSRDREYLLATLEQLVREENSHFALADSIISGA